MAGNYFRHNDGFLCLWHAVLCSWNNVEVWYCTGDPVRSVGTGNVHCLNGSARGRHSSIFCDWLGVDDYRCCCNYCVAEHGTLYPPGQNNERL